MSKAMENYLEKRRIILSTAQKLFLEMGYKSTSMDNVAKKAEVTKQTVYRYFSSKTILFKAIMEKMSEEAQEGHRFGDQSIKIELKEFGKAFLRYHLKKGTIDTIRLLISEGGKDNDLVRIFFKNGIKPAWADQIAAFLRDRLPKVKNPENLGWLFCEILLSPLLPILLGIKNPPTEKEISARVETIVGLFLDGCGAFGSHRL